ncbi:Spat, partial [Trypoxylus dichotomus]
LCNLLEPGEVVLVAINGIWGERFSDMASRYGALSKQLRAPAGDNFTLAEIEEGLAKYKPTLLFVVQGESSTGCYQPIEGIGDLCRR